MRKADLTDIMNIAYRSKYMLNILAENHDKPVQVALHWTAGRYNQMFEDYHINITGDGEYYVSSEDFSKIKYHTYMKNTACIGICMCCCYNANTNDGGEYPPTEAQIEAMAKVMAVLSEALEIDLDIEHFPTHAEAADNLDYDVYYSDYTPYENNTYGPRSTCERWDLQTLFRDEDPPFDPYDMENSGGAILREKAKKYRMSFYGN